MGEQRKPDPPSRDDFQVEDEILEPMQVEEDKEADEEEQLPSVTVPQCIEAAKMGEERKPDPSSRDNFQVEEEIPELMEEEKEEVPQDVEDPPSNDEFRNPHSEEIRYKLLDARKRGDKEIALAAVLMNGKNLQYASEELRNDKEVVLAACQKWCGALQYASNELKNNKEVVLGACSQNGYALEYASEALRNDKEIVLKACSCSQNAGALQYASQELQNSKEIVLTAICQYACSLHLVPEELKNDKDVVLAACFQDGNALRYASESLRADKEVVMAAVKSKPISLMFALGGLNQDKDCLIKAGLWDADHIDRTTMTNIKSDNKSNSPTKRIILSTKFSLAAKSSSHATRFTLELKQHPLIANGEYAIYSPNAFNKGTCDPNWTDINFPCRGTYDSCQKSHHLKIGVPQEIECCWRYSFRYQLEEAHRLGGIMIQVVDWGYTCEENKLGDGQTIESDMAQDVGIKIFRFFERQYSFGDSYTKEVGTLVSSIEKWYAGGCRDMEIFDARFSEKDEVSGLDPEGIIIMSEEELPIPAIPAASHCVPEASPAAPYCAPKASPAASYCAPQASGPEDESVDESAHDGVVFAGDASCCCWRKVIRIGLAMLK